MPMAIGLIVFASIYLYGGRYEATIVGNVDIEQLWKLRDDPAFLNLVALEIGEGSKAGIAERISFTPLKSFALSGQGTTRIHFSGASQDDAARLANAFLDQLDDVLGPTMRQRLALQAERKQAINLLPGYIAAATREFKVVDEAVAASRPLPDAELAVALDALKYWIDLTAAIHEFHEIIVSSERGMRFIADDRPEAPAPASFERATYPAKLGAVLAVLAYLLLLLFWPRSAARKPGARPSH